MTETAKALDSFITGCEALFEMVEHLTDVSNKYGCDPVKLAEELAGYVKWEREFSI